MRATALSARETVTMPHVRERAGAFVVAATATALIAGGGVASAATSSEAPTPSGSGTTAEQVADPAPEADAQAEASEPQSDWVAPIDGDYELSATFGNEGDNWGAGHSGHDFAVDEGTPVQSAHEGTVVKAGGNGAGDGPAYGNAVVIEHPDGTYTQYAHLSAAEVEVGQQVETGEQIGLSGNTGNSTGPHLHFEVRTSADFGSAIDPGAHYAEQGATL